MTYGSVCSGIEAATVAWHPLGWAPRFFAEIDNFPSAVLAHHYPAVPNYGDFTKITCSDSISVLVGGTPCQSFSVAGLRRGFGDERGQLTLEFCRLAQRLNPKWIVWENVPGVLSMDGGRAFASFLGALAQLGYGFAYRVLDAQYFGVAQRRRRVFVVGCLGDWRSAAAVLFEPESLRGYPPPSREKRKDLAPTISERTKGGGGLGTDFDCDGGLVAKCLNARGGAGRIDAESGTFVTHTLRAAGFDASEDGTGRGIPLVTMAIPILEAGARTGVSTNDIRAGSGIGSSGDPMFTLQRGKQHAVAIPILEAGAIASTLKANNRGGGFGSDPSENFIATYPALCVNVRGREGGAQIEVSGDVATALRTAGGGSSKSHALTRYGVRRLTPRECERLQGFPDDYTLIPYRRKMAADGPRYKSLGNSMAVPVMRWIGERIDSVEAQQRGRPRSIMSA